jgi:hypothetical protein
MDLGQLRASEAGSGSEIAQRTTVLLFVREDHLERRGVVAHHSHRH